MTQIRRILSIDGGGIMGVFPASFLATIEESTGKSIAEYFDLIVGTSTGGIIALGLGLGIPAKDIVNIYKELGDSVFSGIPPIKFMKQLFYSKYDQEPLRNALKKSFGKKKIGDSKVRLVIPSMIFDTGKDYLYKTCHHPTLEIDYKKDALEVALATSAAPTFFPAHKSIHGLALIDGGMWANNPTFIGVVEAITKLGWNPDSIRLLSLGCTTSPIKSRKAFWNPFKLAYWAKSAISYSMSGQSASALGMTAQFIGKENLIRICPTVASGLFSLDGVDEVPALEGLGNAEARSNLPKIREMFLTEPAEIFVPCHKL